MQRTERDLCRHAEAEQQQDHRIERDLGERIEPDQDGLGNLARKAMTAQQHADADAAQPGDRQRLGEGKAGLGEMRQEALLPDHLPHVLERGQRGGERSVARPLMQDLPGHQQGDGEQQRAAQGADGGHRPRCLASRRS